MITEVIEARDLLENLRTIKRLMQSAPVSAGSHHAEAMALHEVLHVNVYLIADDGSLLGGSEPVPTPTTAFSFQDIRQLNRLDDTLLNAEEDFRAVAGWMGNRYLAIVPVVAAGQRLATLLAGRDDSTFGPGDQILLEYSATLVGLELFRQNSAAQAAEVRRRTTVEQALSALSYSEQEAVRVLFENLPGDEGVVVASRIADSVGLTRSVIVNALRKLESAGVITSRSLGMKGTFVKVLNRNLVAAVKNSD